MSEGDTENDFLYCGEQYNAQTGLYYLRARYMNPSTGTFISEDSYAGRMHEPVTLHKYLYAHANLLKYVDPSGYYATYADVLGAVALMATLVGVVEIGTGHLRTMLVSMMEDLESIKDSLGMWIRYYIHQAAVKNAEDASAAAKNVGTEVESGASGVSSNSPNDDDDDDNYYKEGLKEVPEDWNQLEDDVAPVKSGSFKEFLKSIGENTKGWKKVMEKWGDSNGNIFQRHYWTNGKRFFYHGDGIEIFYKH